MTLAFLEGFGSPLHWLILGFVCLLIFGRRLPEVGRSLGKGITEFKKGLKDAGEEITGQPQDPYQQQLPPPQRQPQQYQQQGQYPQQQPMSPPRMQAQTGPGGPGSPAGQVRVTRNDMVD